MVGLWITGFGCPQCLIHASLGSGVQPQVVSAFGLGAGSGDMSLHPVVVQVSEGCSCPAQTTYQG